MNTQQLKVKRQELTQAVHNLNRQLEDAVDNGLKVELDALPVEPTGKKPRQMLVCSVWFDVEKLDD